MGFILLLRGFLGGDGSSFGFCCRDEGEKGKGSAKRRREREVCGVVERAWAEGLKGGAWASFGCAWGRSCEEEGGVEEAEGRTATAVDSLSFVCGRAQEALGGVGLEIVEDCIGSLVCV